MPVLDDHINRVNDKLKLLIKHYHAIQKAYERQSRLIVTLEESAAKDKDLIATLEEKVNILKAASGKMNEADKKEFEKNINRYIRDIDKCISLLSE